MGRWCLGFALMLVGSCALIDTSPDEDPLPKVCDGKECSEECEGLSKEGACDVLDRECQERIFDAVGCVRGVDGVLPPVRVISEDEQRAEDEPAAAPESLDAGTEADAETDAGPEDSGPVLPAIPTKLTNRALGLFGLWQERSASEKVERLAGYYAGAQAGITLIERGEPSDSMRLQRALAHELSHAYQDQQFSVGGTVSSFAVSADANLMLGCLIEGEARLYELLSWGLLSGTALEKAFLRDAFQQDMARARVIVATEGSPEHDLRLLCDGLGASYLSGIWLDAGNQAVRAQFDAPPVSSVQWMRAVSSRREERWYASGRQLACIRTAPPEGARAVGVDSLGALRLFAFLSVALNADGKPPVEQSWERALEWQRDSFETFLGPNGEIAASWRIRFSDTIVASALERELGRALPDLRVHREDAELELRATDSAELLESWSNLGACASAF